MTKNIAFFDFDGTITKKDSLIDFLKYYHGNFYFFVGLFILSPILILYKMKLLKNDIAKELMLSYFFKNIYIDIFKKKAYNYSINNINKIIRDEAIQKIKWHKKRNDTIVVVSASIECWIKPWCEINGISFTGKFLTNNCYGIEKENRIKDKYNLSDYDCIYAYGDSKGDYEMLQLADKDKKFYRCF